MKSALSSKGQVTIPKSVRDRLGLRPGMRIEFRAERGRLIGTKSLPIEALRRWRGRGKLPGNPSVDAYLDDVRGPRAHRR